MNRILFTLKRLEPARGIEPLTYGLQNRCSTTELRGQERQVRVERTVNGLKRPLLYRVVTRQNVTCLALTYWATVADNYDTSSYSPLNRNTATTNRVAKVDLQRTQQARTTGGQKVPPLTVVPSAGFEPAYRRSRNPLPIHWTTRAYALLAAAAQVKLSQACRISITCCRIRCNALQARGKECATFDRSSSL